MTLTEAVVVQGERYVRAMRAFAAATARHTLEPNAENTHELVLAEHAARLIHGVLTKRYLDMDAFFPRASAGLTRQIYQDAAAAQREAFREVIAGADLARLVA